MSSSPISSRKSRIPARRSQRRLQLERLEARQVMAAYVWTGAAGTDWANPGNWNTNNGTVPDDAADTVTINDVANDPVLDSARTIGSLAGNGPLNLQSFTLTVDNSATSSTTFGGVLSGAGGIRKAGANSLTLTGNNTYSGGTTISGGELRFSEHADLGASNSPVIFDGGTLNYTHTSIKLNPFQHPFVVNPAGGTIQVTGNFNGGSGTGATDGKITMTLANVISGTGTLVKTGLAPLTIVQAQPSFSGNWILNSGFLEAGNSLSLGTGSVTINGGELAINTGDSAATPVNPLTFNGGSLSMLSNGETATYAGPITANSNFTIRPRDFWRATSGRTFTLSGPISGPGGIIIDDSTGVGATSSPGTVILSNPNNTYTGGTTIHSGRLQVTGAISSHVVINADGESAGTTNNLVVRQNSNNLEVLNGSTVMLSAPSSNVSSLTVNGQNGNDTLTVNYTVGGFFDTPITFHGGNQAGSPGDTLSIVAGAIDTATYNYTNAHDGSVVLDPDGPGGAAAHTIRYTGLEPITNSGTVTHAVFNLPETDDVASVENVGGLLRLSGSTFETTDITLPTGSLTIIGRGGSDTVQFTSALALPGDLTVRAESVTQTAPLSVAGTASFVGGGDYANAVLANDPYMYLPFNETSGTTVNSAVNGLTGNLLGSAGSVDFDRPGPIPSDPLNRAWHFNPAAANSGRHIDFADFVPASITGDGAYAFEFWFKPDTTAGSRTIYAATHSPNPGAVHASFVETSNTAGRFRAVDRSPSGTSREITPSTVSYSTSQWQHVVFQVSGGKVQLFVNGVLDPNSPDAVPAWGTNTKLVLARLSGTQAERYYDGLLDEFAIYDEPLTPAQINAHIAAATVTSSLTSVALDNAANDFGTVVFQAATDVTLRDANDVRIEDSSATGAVTITATGDVTLADSLPVGSLAVAAASSRVGGDITAGSGGVTFTGDALTTASVAINTAAGNGDITFNDAVQSMNSGAADLTISAGTGNVAFHGPVGGAVGDIVESSSNVFVVEAENYTSRTAVSGGNNDTWRVLPDEGAGSGPVAQNARGGRWIQSLPDDGAGGGGPNVAPYIDYQLSVTDPGSYRLYLRWDGNATNVGTSDSIYAGIVELQDGAGGTNPDWYLFARGIDANFNTTPWDSSAGFEQTGGGISGAVAPNFNITTPGVYTVRIWQREDGATVDAFVLQQSSLPAPSGAGPLDTGRIGTLTINSAATTTFDAEVQAVDYLQYASNATFADGAYLTGNFFADRGNVAITGDLLARSLRVASRDVVDQTADVDLTVSGGRVAIGDGSAGTVFDVARRSITRSNGSNILGDVDFSAATSVSIDVEEVRLGTVVGDAGIARGTVTLSTLGANALRADTLVIGDSTSPGATGLTSELSFGPLATNTLNVDNIYVGRRKATGRIDIAAGGTLAVGGNTTAAGNLYLGYNDVNGTGTVSDGRFDMTGGTVNGAFNQMVLGLHNSGGAPGSGIGIFTMAAGSVTAASVVLGDASNEDSATNHSGAPASTLGVLRISGGTFHVTGDVSNDPSNNPEEDPTGARPATGRIEVTGGTVDVDGTVNIDSVFVDHGAMTVGAGLTATNVRVGLAIAGTSRVAALTVESGDVTIGDGAAGTMLDIARRDASLVINNSTTGTLDLTSVDSVVINVDGVRLGQNLNIDGSTSTGDTRGTLLLPTAATSSVTVTANAVTVEDSPGEGQVNDAASQLVLGGGTNTFNVDTLTVAGRKSNGSLTITAGGSFTLAGKAPGTAADLRIGDNLHAGTGVHAAGSIDLTGGTVNATVDELIIGRHGSGAGSGSGTLTFTTGVISANAIRLALTDQTGGSDNDAASVATINLSGGTLRFGTLSKGNGLANFNFNSGTLQNAAGQDLVNQNVVINLLTAAQHTLEVDAGQTATIQTGARLAGSGSLTKTGEGVLVLAGNNTYTGGTLIDEGALQVANASGSATGSGLVTVNAAGTLTGNGIVVGNVTGAGTVSPGGAGVGTLSITGNFAPSGTLHFDVNAPFATAGTDYDRINVTGGVDLAGATLTFDQSAAGATVEGQTLVLIDNNLADATGPAADPLEGEVVGVGSSLFEVRYNAGSGNDVVLTARTPEAATIDADTTVVGDNDIVVRQEGTELVVLVNGAEVFREAVLLVTELTINGQTGNDALTIDYDFGGTFATPITFHGGPQTASPGDVLNIVGGTYHTATYNYFNATDGDVQLDPDGPGGVAPTIIVYTGLEPISNVGTATNVILNLPATADAAEVQDLGGGMTRFRSLNGTFETTEFATPSGSLTINLGGGDDNLRIVSLAGAGALTINGDADTDRIELLGTIALSGGGAEFTAETTMLGANLTTGAAGSAVFNGPVYTTLPTTINTSAGGGGDIIFNGTLQSIGAQNLALNAGTGGNVLFNDEVGQASTISVPGQFVIEAENYTSREDFPGVPDSWRVIPDEGPSAGTLSGARGKYVQALPDGSGGGGGPNVAPSISYALNISTPGTYRLYVRWDGNGTNGGTQGASDSMFVDIVELKDNAGGAIADWYEMQHTVDGSFNSTPWDNNGGFEQNVAGISATPIRFTVTEAGVYTVRFSQREDGAAIDAFVLQLDGVAAPTGTGPAETGPQGGAVSVSAGRLGTVSIVSANNLTAAGDFSSGTYQQSALAGTATFNGDVHVTGSANIDNGDTVVNGSLTATTGGRIAYTNTGAATEASLTVNGGAVSIGSGSSSLQIGRRESATASTVNPTRGTADFRNATSVNVNVSSILLGMNSAGALNMGAGDQTRGTLLLSTNGSNTLRASAGAATSPATSGIVIGDSPSPGNWGPIGGSTEVEMGNRIILGNGTNTISTNTLTIGGRKSSGIIRFDGTGGTLQINGAAGGASTANVFIADNNVDTGVTNTSRLDTLGGTLNAQIGQLVLGRRSSSGGSGGLANGTLSMSAGTVTATSIALGANRTQASGTINLNGGTLIVDGAIQNGAGSGAINLSGGTLQFVTLTKGAGALNVNFNSGTIQNVVGQNLDVTNATINLLTGDAHTLSVDAGQTATIQSAAQLAGAGSLRKTGAGTLALAGDNTYGGGTTIDQGTLQIANTGGSATGSGLVTVNTGGTLAGEGTVAGSVVLNGNGQPTGNAQLLPGFGEDDVGTINIGGNLTINSGYTQVEVSAAGHDRANVAGQVSITGVSIAEPDIVGAFLPAPTPLVLLASGSGITGAFVGTQNPTGPDIDFDGYPAQVVYNGGDGNDLEVTIIVNTPPVARDDSFAINENGTLNSNVITNTNPNGADFDPENDTPLTVTAVGPLPAGLSLASNGNVSYTPPSGFSGTVSFQYFVTDPSGANSNTATATIVVSPVATTPSLTVNPTSITINEDASTALGISGSLNDTDGSETLSFRISGVTGGAALTAGANAGGGVWNLTPAQLSGLRFIPAPNSDADYSLSVIAIATESAGGATASSSPQTITINVNAVADTPALGTPIVVSNPSFEAPAHGDGGFSSGTSGTAAIQSWEILPGTGNAGVFNPGVAQYSAQQATQGSQVAYSNGLAFRQVLPANLAPNTTYTLLVDIGDRRDTTVPGYSLQVLAGGNVQATATQADFPVVDNSFITARVTFTTGSSVTAGQALEIRLASAGGQTNFDNVRFYALSGVSGNEDTAIALNLAGAVQDLDGSETLSYRISGVPTGATFSSGTNVGGGVWTFTAAQAAGLTITPAPQSDADFTLSVEAIATDTGNVTAVAPAPLVVQVVAVADLPTLTVPASVSGLENTPIPLTIVAALGDTDGSETLSVTIGGVPADATIVGGTQMNATTWTVSGSAIGNAALVKDDNNAGNAPFTLTFVATATESDPAASPRTRDAAAASMQVTVTNVAPSPQEDEVRIGGVAQDTSGGSISVVPGLPVTFVVSTSDLALDDVDQPFTFEIDFGDGLGLATGVATAEGEQLEFTYAYQTRGNFQPTLTVTDKPHGGAERTSDPLNLTPIISGSQIVIDGTLYVAGEGASDRIIVQPSGSGGVRVRMNNALLPRQSVSDRVVVYGNAGNDTITVSGSLPFSVEFYGGEGDDYLAGGTRDDLLDGGSGRDRLLGGSGSDRLYGGDDKDTLSGGLGADHLSGDEYIDLVGGTELEDGSLSFAGDVLLGLSPAGDTLKGDGGADVLLGGGAADILSGGTGNDRLFGGLGNDRLDGGDGADLLVGDAGGDTLYGRGGRDVLIGGADIDTLYGYTGADLVYGGDIDAVALDATALDDVWMLWSSSQADLALEALDAGAFDDGMADTLHGESDADWYLKHFGDFFKLQSEKNRPNVILER